MPPVAGRVIGHNQKPFEPTRPDGSCTAEAGTELTRSATRGVAGGVSWLGSGSILRGSHFRQCHKHSVHLLWSFRNGRLGPLRRPLSTKHAASLAA